MESTHNHKFEYDKFVRGFASCSCGTYKSYDITTKSWTTFEANGQKVGA